MCVWDRSFPRFKLCGFPYPFGFVNCVLLVRDELWIARLVPRRSATIFLILAHVLKRGIGGGYAVLERLFDSCIGNMLVAMPSAFHNCGANQLP